MIKWDATGERIFDETADYSDFQGVRFIVPLSQSKEPLYLALLDDKVAKARERGLAVMLCIDYHVQDPYHGPPPHNGGGNENAQVRAGGLGYAPFGWIRGWVWAREGIANLLSRYQPEAMQQSERPDIRVGWGWATKPEYHFNDTLSIYQQGAFDADWRGAYVVPVTPEIPNIQKRAPHRAKQARDGMPGFDPIHIESQYQWAVVPDAAEEPIDPDPGVDDPEDPIVDPDPIVVDPDPILPPMSQRLARRSLEQAQKGNWNVAVRLMKRARRKARLGE